LPAALSLVADARRVLVAQLALTSGSPELRERVATLLAGELDEEMAVQVRADLDLIALRLLGDDGR
jgi:hypothetical protein